MCMGCSPCATTDKKLDTVVNSKVAIPWRFVVVERNHSWWLSFKLPSNMKEARTSSAAQPARQSLMLGNNNKSGHLGEGLGKDWTYKVLSHTPKKKKNRNNHTQILVGEMLRNYLVRIQHHAQGIALSTRQGDRIRVALSGAQAVRWPGIPKVTRSRLTACSKSCDLQPHCTVQYVELRGYCSV